MWPSPAKKQEPFSLDKIEKVLPIKLVLSPVKKKRQCMVVVVVVALSSACST
jgi:hypothetical protein